MVTISKPVPSNQSTVNLANLTYWDDYVGNYFHQRNSIQDWTQQYIKAFYFQLVNRALRQLNPNENSRVLKVDLWNEGVETSRDILSNVKGVETVGFDLSKVVCRLAKNRVSKLELAQATCQTLPFASEKFDIVLDLSTIDHIPFSQVGTVFSEYYRVLKPQGLLAMAFWQSNAVTKYFFNSAPDQLYFEKKKVKRSLEDKGFVVIESYDIGSLLTISESNLWLSQFVFWQFKRILEDKFFNSVAKMEQYLFNMLGGLHVYYARRP